MESKDPVSFTDTTGMCLSFILAKGFSSFALGASTWGICFLVFFFNVYFYLGVEEAHLLKLLLCKKIYFIFCRQLK